MSSIGPQIPAHFLKKSREESEEASISDNKSYAPVAPPSPPKPTVDVEDSDDDSDDDAFAPALPPDLAEKPKASARVIGPSFPTLPPLDDDSDDDYGPTPLPPGAERDSTGDGVKEFMEREEKRRKNVEDASKPQKLKRDEWMLVPPKASDLLGSLDPTKLKARQFSRNTEEKSTDRTLWTETPAERLARLADEVSGKRKRVENAANTEMNEEEKKRRKRDKEIQKVVDEHNTSKRGKSLLDLHSSSGSAKASIEAAEKEKVGIWDHSRDMGLGGRLMDDSKRKAIISDAKGLGSRFGHGKSGGYL